MEKEELIKFAENYSSDQYDEIKFDWNGKHGDDFVDINYDFRIQLCETIKDDFSICPDQLIVDLYIELAKWAKEAFCVYNNFHLFANELLERGGVKNFDKYVEGASKSMDTGMSSGILKLSNSRIKEILSHIKSKLNDSNENDDLKGYAYMLKRFEWLKKQTDDK